VLPVDRPPRDGALWVVGGSRLEDVAGRGSRDCSRKGGCCDCPRAMQDIATRNFGGTPHLRKLAPDEAHNVRRTPQSSLNSPPSWASVTRPWPQASSRPRPCAVPLLLMTSRARWRTRIAA